MSIRFVPTFLAGLGTTHAHSVLGLVTRTTNLAVSSQEFRFQGPEAGGSFENSEYYVFQGDRQVIGKRLDRIQREATELQNGILADSDRMPRLEWQALSKYLTRLQRTAAAYREGAFENPFLAVCLFLHSAYEGEAHPMSRQNTQLGYGLYQLMGAPFVLANFLRLYDEALLEKESRQPELHKRPVFNADEIANSGLGILGLRLALFEGSPIDALSSFLRSQELGVFADHAAVHSRRESDGMNGYLIGSLDYVGRTIAQEEKAQSPGVTTEIVSLKETSTLHADPIAAAAQFGYRMVWR